MAWTDEIAKLEQRLENALKDAATLTVNTLKGNVTAEYKNGSWVVTPDAAATVVAQTEVRIDGDVDTIVPTTADGKADAAWLELHNDVVRAATQSRAELLRSIAEFVKSFKLK